MRTAISVPMNDSSTPDATTQGPSDTGVPPAKETAVPEAPHGEGVDAPPAQAAEAAESPIAPDVPRLARPTGTAGAIPETILSHRSSPTFLAVVAVTSLAADISTKLWAEKKLEAAPGFVTVVDNHLMFILAKNKGGAWGLLQNQSESVRRPFFLLVSVAAIAFIVTLYRRLQPNQHALKWGLPLVLGGALGNVFDRIRYGYVIDFIDYRADWIRKFNEFVHKYYPSHSGMDHWPTFNVADIAICVGVGLMAIDMLTARRMKPAYEADVPLEPTAAPATAAATETPAATESTEHPPR